MSENPVDRLWRLVSQAKSPTLPNFGDGRRASPNWQDTLFAASLLEYQDEERFRVSVSNDLATLRWAESLEDGMLLYLLAISRR